MANAVKLRKPIDPLARPSCPCPNPLASGSVYSLPLADWTVTRPEFTDYRLKSRLAALEPVRLTVRSVVHAKVEIKCVVLLIGPGQDGGLQTENGPFAPRSDV